MPRLTALALVAVLGLYLAAADPLRETVSLRQDLRSSSVDLEGKTALDGLSLEQILAFRMAKVREYQRLGLFADGYHPLEGDSRRIYQGITSGMKWLGPTADYVANPYVLVVMVAPQPRLP